MTVTRPFFIDTDTASDDAVAMVMALRDSTVQVVGIGVVAGNVPLDQGVQNALFIVELCDASDRVPVYAGCDRPLQLPLSMAQKEHGSDGMGDIGLDLTGRTPAAGHAVDALLEAAERFAGKLTLVTLGPLTNVAVALQRDPTLASKVARCVIMGAVADHIGNITPVAEFNMWVDPHAVAVVLASGMPLEFVGWDISRFFAVIEPDLAAELRAVGTRQAEVCIDIQVCVSAFCATETKLAGFDLPDPIAMAYALDPRVATKTRHVHCAVETQSELTRGMVVMDMLELGHQTPNALVVMHADRDRFIAMLRTALS